MNSSKTNRDLAFIEAPTPSSPSPSLTIQRTTTNTVVVSWPWSAAGFVLQQNADGVSSLNWSNVVDAIQDDETIKALIVNPINSSRLYRLIRP